MLKIKNEWLMLIKIFIFKERWSNILIIFAYWKGTRAIVNLEFNRSWIAVWLLGPNRSIWNASFHGWHNFQNCDQQYNAKLDYIFCQILSLYMQQYPINKQIKNIQLINIPTFKFYFKVHQYFFHILKDWLFNFNGISRFKGINLS